jgi:hypothetical protein
MSDAAADAPPAKKSDGPPRRSAKDKTCYNCGEVRFCTSAYHIPTWYQSIAGRLTIAYSHSNRTL